MTKLIGLVFLAVISFTHVQGFAQANPVLKGLRTAETADSFKLTYDFSEKVNTESVSVDFIGDSIVIDIPNIDVEKKVTSKVDSSIVKSVSAEKVDGGVKGTINYRGIKAKEFKESISVESSGESLTVIVTNPPHIIAKLPEKNIVVTRSLPSIPPNDMASTLTVPANGTTTEVVDESQSVLQEKPASLETAALATKDQAAVPTSADGNANKIKSEEEIPVFAQKSKAGAAGESPFQKIILTVVAISLLGMGAFVFIKRTSLKKNKESSLMQIKMITQYHIAPKKTLAVVRVAGESILIGITDQNITVLKTLSLLDEEIPEVTANDFKALMKPEANKSAMTDDEVMEEFAFGGMKDRVTNSLKTKRSFV